MKIWAESATALAHAVGVVPPANILWQGPVKISGRCWAIHANRALNIGGSSPSAFAATIIEPFICSVKVSVAR